MLATFLKDRAIKKMIQKKMTKEKCPHLKNTFVKFFQFVEERESGLASARENRWINIRVNRSVVGQQPTLSTLDNATLNKTVATPGRERETGEVASKIVINEISQASSELNNKVTECSKDRISWQFQNRNNGLHQMTG